jgi:hypothetical protein
MEASVRVRWLRRVMLTKVLCIFALWASPLIAPASLLRMFAIEMPPDPLFLRLFGALQTSLGVAYWFAYRDPVKNVAIVKVCIFENALVAATIVVVGMTSGVSSWFVWFSAGLAALFCVVISILHFNQ